MNIINGNVNTITNEVGTKADALAPIISFFGTVNSTVEELELAA